MRKPILFCLCVLALAGCAPSRDPLLGDRDERSFPDPAQGVKNAESATYSTQQLASPSATAPAAVQSAPVTKKPVPAPGHTMSPPPANSTVPAAPAQ